MAKGQDTRFHDARKVDLEAWAKKSVGEMALRMNADPDDDVRWNDRQDERFETYRDDH